MILNANRKRVLGAGGGGGGYTSMSISSTDTYDWSSDGGVVILRGWDWKPDETTFWGIEYGGGDDVFRYDMSTAADLTTVSYIGFQNGQLPTPVSMAYGDSGGYYYVLNASDSKIYRYTTGSAYDNTSLTSGESLLTTVNSNSFIISADGSTIWLSDSVGSGGILTIDLTTPFSLTGGDTQTLTSIDGLQVDAFCFLDSGNYLMVLDASSTLGLYALSVAYDVSTKGTVIDTDTLTVAAFSFSDIYVSNANDKLFHLNGTTKLFTEYALTLA